MAYDQKANCGTLFINSYKRTANYPDYSGPINVDGKNYYISGWIKTAGPTAKNPGSKFLSLSIQPAKVDVAANPANATFNGNEDPDYDEDIPF